MSQIVISDLFEELKEENARLLTQLLFAQKCIQLLDNYRNCLISYNNNCKCNEIINNKNVFNLLEIEYKYLLNDNGSFSDKNQITANQTSIIEHFKTGMKQTEKSINCANNEQIINNSKSVKTFNNNDKLKIVSETVNRKIRALDQSQVIKSIVNVEHVKNETNIQMNDEICFEESNDNNYGTNANNEDNNLNADNEYIIENYSRSLSKKTILEYMRLNKIVEVIDSKNNMISELRLKIDGKSEEAGKIVGFRCNWAQCRFISTRRAVISHQMSKHSDERPFICNICDKKFAVKKYLRRHQIYVHSKGSAKKLKCDWPQCQYETYRKSIFESHCYRHKNIKAFKCDISGCEDVFYSPGGLYYHKNIVHNESRPFLCEWPGCDAAFKVKRSLENHRTTHTRNKCFKCDFPNCGMSFVLKFHLYKHKRTHEPVKRYVCDWPECDKSFSDKYEYNGHILKHRGERPFKCHISGCTKDYFNRKNLRLHLKTHEAIN